MENKDGYLIRENGEKLIISFQRFTINVVANDVVELIIPENIRFLYCKSNKKLKSITLPKLVQVATLDHHCIITNFDEIKDNCTIRYESLID